MKHVPNEAFRHSHTVARKQYPLISDVTHKGYEKNVGVLLERRPEPAAAVSAPVEKAASDDSLESGGYMMHNVLGNQSTAILT